MVSCSLLICAALSILHIFQVRGTCFDGAWASVSLLYGVHVVARSWFVSYCVLSFRSALFYSLQVNFVVVTGCLYLLPFSVFFSQQFLGSFINQKYRLQHLSQADRFNHLHFSGICFRIFFYYSYVAHNRLPIRFTVFAYLWVLTRTRKILLLDVLCSLWF